MKVCWIKMPQPYELMGNLSGGQKNKAFLTGITIHEPQIVLLDEPSSHLNAQARAILYEYIQQTTATLVVVNHDRTLLNLLPNVYGLSNALPSPLKRRYYSAA